MAPLSQRAYGGSQAAEPGAAVTPDARSVSGTITLAESLKDRIPGGATLFVMARERTDGGGPPYAVRRLPVPGFPFPYTLGQGDVLPMFGEGLEFGDIDEMYVVARVDLDGMAGPPTSGDMEGVSKVAVKPGQSRVDLVIDKVY